MPRSKRKLAGPRPMSAKETERWDDLKDSCPDDLRRDFELFRQQMRDAGTLLNEDKAGAVARYFMRFPKYPEIWPRFRGELCHLTTVANWAGILEVGRILPSGSGHWNWHDPARGGSSQALTKGAVALFELAGLETRQFIQGYWALGTIGNLLDADGRGVWLTIHREKLPAVLERVGDGTKGKAVPHWETHHCDAIPLSAVRAVHQLTRTPAGRIITTPASWSTPAD